MMCDILVGGFDIIYNNGLYVLFLQIVVWQCVVMLILLYVLFFYMLCKVVQDCVVFWLLVMVCIGWYLVDYWFVLSLQVYVQLNGIDFVDWLFCVVGNGQVVWVGCIIFNKGLYLVIVVVWLVGILLMLFGVIEDESYFCDQICLVLSGGICYVGYFESYDLVQQIGWVLVVLFMLFWDELFGLVVIEVMVCGLFVVVICNGVVDEVIGEVGVYVVFDVLDFVWVFVQVIVWVVKILCYIFCVCVEWLFLLDWMLDGYQVFYYDVMVGWVVNVV